jgi:hypothetical protein
MKSNTKQHTGTESPEPADSVQDHKTFTAVRDRNEALATVLAKAFRLLLLSLLSQLNQDGPVKLTQPAASLSTGQIHGSYY